MKHTSKTIFILFFLIILSISVVAEPPFLTESQTSGSDGLYIKYPQNPFYIMQSSMEFHFHVFNSSGYVLDNTTTSCIIHVYNATNNHILKQTATFDNDLDFEVELGSNISNIIGYYSYIFECESDSQAGFVGESFEITDTTAKENTISGSVLAVLILLPIIFGIMMMLGAFVLDPDEHPVLRIFLFLFSFITYFLSSWLGVLSLIQYYNFSTLQNSTVTSVWVAGIMMFIVISYFMVYVFYKLSHAAAQKKDEMMLK